MSWAANARVTTEAEGMAALMGHDVPERDLNWQWLMMQFLYVAPPPKCDTRRGIQLHARTLNRLIVMIYRRKMWR